TDEGVAGHATRVEVTLHPDGSVQVDDDGRGIPTDVHAKSGLSGVELVLTKLHAGGKFGGSGYKTSGGLHGVGASAVNALSRRFEAGAVLDVEAVRAKLRHTAFLVPRVTYLLWDATGAAPVEETFHFPAGLADMVDFLSPPGDQPVCGTLLVMGEGSYKENAA